MKTKKFPLTDVQFAYMTGRNENFYLGGNATHFYVEFNSKLDMKKYERAVNKVIQKQKMLRTCILEDGTQYVKEDVPYYNMFLNDISALTKEEQDKVINNYRKENSGKQFALGSWPMFEFAGFKLNDEISRLVVNFDMMIIDGMSTEILISEILYYYNNPDEEVTIMDTDFSDYILNKKENDKIHIEKDKEFWNEKLIDFPLGPFTHDIEEAKALKDHTFTCKEHTIPKELWQPVSDKLKKKRLLPTIYLLTAYAKVLSIYSGQPKLAINVTMSDRKSSSDKNFYNVIGDFTKVLPIDFDFSDNKDFYEICRLTQSKFASYKKHLSYNTIEFMKEVAKNEELGDKPAFPVVFTGMMFDYAKSGWNLMGDRVYQISQTPQVLLDNQITLRNGALTIHFDYPEKCFDNIMIDEIHKSFIDLVVNEDNKVIKSNTEDIVKAYNNTNNDFKYESVVSLIEDQVVENKDKVAIITDEKQLTYGQLNSMANKEANYLLKKYGQKKGYVVDGVRNYTTLVHILAILKTGGYYIPVASNVPESRKKFIMKNSNAIDILYNNFYYDEGCDKEVDIKPIISDYNEDKDDIAYIIYTSGTTGNPKGVVISYEAMLNTVLDINNRFNVTNKDQIIAISSFGFDLSVYDVFGALLSGASILLNDKQENIFGMIDKLKKYPVTIWNTVPSLMELLVNELDKDYKNETLRLVLLSGDWIPTDLPAKIKIKFPNAKVISLGGATEAAIWSIYYEVEEVNNKLSSIPYGYPLHNQQIYILNYDGNICPVGVEGEICIGGIGVALGYQNEPEKTKKQFIDHPLYGRLYVTGDRGILSREGYVIFCGRKDSQIKIHGNRIELGEIENSLKTHQDIINAVANVVTDDNNSKRLLAYYVTKDNKLCNKEWIDETAKLIDEKLDIISEEVPLNVTIDEFTRITEELENVSLAIIINTFACYDLFTDKDQIYSLEELFNEKLIVPKYHKLIYQWADTLEKNDYIKKINEGLYSVENTISYIDIEKMYTEIMKLSGVEHWKGSFEFLTLCNKNIRDILKADVNPLTILFPEGNLDRADNIYRYNPVAEYNNKLMAEVIENYIKNCKFDRPVRILEFGAGTGGTSAAVLDKIKDYNISYTFTDLTTFFTSKAEERFKEYDFVEYKLFNIDKTPQEQGYEPESFDIIFGANVLHDAKIIKNTLKSFRYMLSKEGILAALEVTTNKIYHKVSIGLIDGFSGYNDERLIKNEPLLSSDEWQDYMIQSGFTNTASYPKKEKRAEAFEQHVVLSFASKNRSYCNEEELRKLLEEKLPSYMIPDKIYALDEIPLSTNLKINYKALPYEKITKEVLNKNIVLPKTETEQILHDVIIEALNLEELSTDVNIFTIGADSLKSISVLTKLKNMNIEVSLSELYKNPTIIQMAKYIDDNKETTKICNEDNEEMNFKISLEDRYKPFPLSDLQESYYIGSHETEGFNSIPTAGYVEIECKEYDHDKMMNVLLKLIKRHDMLRAYIDNEGMQHIQKEMPDFTMEVTDMSNKSEKELETYILKVRKEMLSLRLDLSKAPLILGKVTKIDDKKALLHVYADGQIMDGWSFELFFSELGMLYKSPNTELEPLKVTFRDYIMYREALKETEKYKKDKEFWLSKINNIPEAGTLPLLKDIDKLDEVEGIQVECGIPIEEWRQIEKKSREYGVSAFSVLFTSFAISVARWNDKKRFLLNIPEFYRPDFHPDIFKVIGECASFLLFTVEENKDETFYEKVVKTQKQIMELKDHNSFTGMEITREIYRKNNGYSDALAPIVFGMLPETPHFEETFIDVERNLLKVRYQENHTSQIWIDVNTCVYSDRIEFNYNSLKGLISKDVLSSLAVMQKSILHEAAENNQFWNSKVDLKLPEKDEFIINNANGTKVDYNLDTFPSLINKSFEKYSSNEFVKSANRVYSYNEIFSYVKKMSSLLNEKGIKPGDYVGLYIDKSIEQIVAALAIVYSGAVYIPMEYSYPSNTVSKALEAIDCKMLITSSEKENSFLNDNLKVLVADLNDLESYNENTNYSVVNKKDLVSIIHTSGSTGKPKAVMIKQNSLMNAIKYTNERFNVTSDDSAIALTNYAHDMSLYDLFGMIEAGGSIVLIEEKYVKDPEKWIEMMNKYKVTIWNSVPAMQEMLYEALEDDKSSINNLRLIMLGGDYIKTTLARRIIEDISNVKLVSVGGPTETTLWNIMHEVTEEDLKTDTIPYGKPIANNKYYILNENMQKLPIGVTGTLYCAGIGVTKGYCNDEVLTSEKYVKYEETGEIIYNTGDRGHYREDGTIIFDGRSDYQIKINGKRIELNGISSVAQEIEEVNNCIAIKSNKNQILLFYTAEYEVPEGKFIDTISNALPSYMVPKQFIKIDTIPLTNNGKIDKNELLRIYEKKLQQFAKKKAKTKDETLDSSIETELKEMFSEMLDIPKDIDIDDDFFTLGGNSLIAMRLLSQIREKYKVEISLTDLFTTSTIREMKELLEEKIS